MKIENCIAIVTFMEKIKNETESSCSETNIVRKYVCLSVLYIVNMAIMLGFFLMFVIAIFLIKQF